MREITATVLENKRIADEVYSLTFAADDEIAVRPGQFCMIGVGGYPLRRPIAVCKSGGVRITVCYRLKGDGTRSLARDYKMGENFKNIMARSASSSVSGRGISTSGVTSSSMP